MTENESIKKMIEFARAEETIYNSCGMPTRFKIVLSCAFQESEKTLSPAKYKSINIRNTEDLYNPKIKKEIIDREKISSFFTGGNEVTFYKLGTSFDIPGILREISVILETYNIPFFSYDFKYVTGDMKLTSFFE